MLEGPDFCLGMINWGLQVNELTVDSVQLTVMVSLRDNLEIIKFISEGNTLTVNCQLSTVNS